MEINNIFKKIFSNKLVRYIIYICILLALAYPLTQSIGLGGGGFDSATVLTQRSFYVGDAVVAAILVLGFGFFEYFIRKSENQYGDSISFINQGEFPAVKWFGKFSNTRIILFSMILCTILGLAAILTQQTAFTAFGMSQQFTPVGSILYAFLLIPISENLGMFAVIAIEFTILRLIAKKYNFTPSGFKYLCWFVIPVSCAAYGGINHLLRYSSSESSITTVLLFWALMGLVTVLTGSSIPSLFMHAMNNLFFDLKTYYSNDIISIFSGIVIFLSIALYLYIYYGRKKKET